ncbi:DNA topoisomerase, partial [Okeania sp. SIO2G5]|uniref:DNA topoisomerase n=1 Tax=Okeania sp. SIO2G5 TaxID=2607796 RepID=UPI0013BEFEAD
KGIGRPSTYAPTIKTLRSRTYVQLVKGKLQPTPLGLELDAALAVMLPDLIQPDFTAQMESSLDTIAQGQQEWQSYLTSWYRTYFGPAIAQAKHQLQTGAVRQQLIQQQTAATTSAQPVSTIVPIAPPPTSTVPLHGSPAAPSRQKSAQLSKSTAPTAHPTSKVACPKCQEKLHKIPSKSKKMRAKHFLKCMTPGCNTVMFWNGKQKSYELPYSQRQPDPTQFTEHPCPVCGAWLERYGYTKEAPCQCWGRSRAPGHLSGTSSPRR